MKDSSQRPPDEFVAIDYKYRLSSYLPSPRHP
jgi:hypothetical protein